MRKFFLWVLISSVLLIGVYFIFQQSFNDFDGGSVFEKVKEIALEKISAINEFIKGKTGKTLEEASINSYSYVKKSAGGALTFLGDSIESLGGQLMGEVSTSSLPYLSLFPTSSSSADGESGFFLPPPLFAVSGKVGEPLFFSLNRAGTYSVLWGDGEKEAFQVNGAEVKVAGHSWTRHGDFEIAMTFTSGTIREEWRVFARIME